MQSCGQALAAGEACQAIPAAVEISGETGARFSQGPLEQRIVTAEHDARTLSDQRDTAPDGILFEPG